MTKQNVFNLVDSLDHIYDKMPKLLEQYECHSLQKKNKMLVHKRSVLLFSISRNKRKRGQL